MACGRHEDRGLACDRICYSDHDDFHQSPDLVVDPGTGWAGIAATGAFSPTATGDLGRQHPQVLGKHIDSSVRNGEHCGVVPAEALSVHQPQYVTAWEPAWQ
jgi:hypothetical protein